MPWASGLRPVIIEVHAGGVSGLRVDISSARTPAPTTERRCGITPLRIIGSSNVKVAPSSPIIKTFIKNAFRREIAGRLFRDVWESRAGTRCFDATSTITLLRCKQLPPMPARRHHLVNAGHHATPSERSA